MWNGIRDYRWRTNSDLRNYINTYDLVTSLPVLRKRHQVPTGLAAEAVDYSKPSNAKITLHSLLCGLLRKLNVLLAVLPVHFMVPTKPVESSRN